MLCKVHVRKNKLVSKDWMECGRENLRAGHCNGAGEVKQAGGGRDVGRMGKMEWYVKCWRGKAFDPGHRPSLITSQSNYLEGWCP